MTAPRVSIITTVYDRVACLARCVRATQLSLCVDHEHLIVSDAPGATTETAIAALVASLGDPRLRYLPRIARANDWGMTPAHDGLRAAVGDYVCFLSDDNAYLPEHFAPLVAALDADPRLGFAYSSCLYAGRMELRVAPPAPSRIDLGQPLFRRSHILGAFPAGFPFHEFAWDWRVIKTLIDRGSRWRHVDAATFVFRLAAYQRYVEALA